MLIVRSVQGAALPLPDDSVLLQLVLGPQEGSAQASVCRHGRAVLPGATSERTVNMATQRCGVHDHNAYYIMQAELAERCWWHEHESPFHSIEMGCGVTSIAKVSVARIKLETSAAAATLNFVESTLSIAPVP